MVLLSGYNEVAAAPCSAAGAETNDCLPGEGTAFSTAEGHGDFPSRSWGVLSETQFYQVA